MPTPLPTMSCSPLLSLTFFSSFHRFIPVLGESISVPFGGKSLLSPVYIRQVFVG